MMSRKEVPRAGLLKAALPDGIVRSLTATTGVENEFISQIPATLSCHARHAVNF